MAVGFSGTRLKRNILSDINGNFVTIIFVALSKWKLCQIIIKWKYSQVILGN